MADKRRLIDANALLLEYCQANGCNEVIDEICPNCFTAGLIANAPTVDAVEVVRCGKCLYYSETTGKDSGKPCGYGVCTKPFHITNIVANEDFCSFGQRRVDAKMDGDGNG